MVKKSLRGVEFSQFALITLEREDGLILQDSMEKTLKLDNLYDRADKSVPLLLPTPF